MLGKSLQLWFCQLSVITRIINYCQQKSTGLSLFPPVSVIKNEIQSSGKLVDTTN